MAVADSFASAGTALHLALRAAHARALTDLKVQAIGRVRFGRRGRSVGSAVERTGSHYWMRVIWARREQAHGALWTGTQEASTIAGVERPRLIDVRGWEEGPVVYRAELLSLLPGRPVASSAVLDRVPGLDVAWWNELERSIAVLSTTRTARMALDPEAVSRRIAVFFGVDLDVEVDEWVPAHADLNWNNLHRGPFAIVDWDSWGLAPRGYSAAFLLAHSLAVPSVAERIARVFRDDLASEGGVVSQLSVMATLLARADRGERLDLVPAIHRQVERLLGTRTSFVPREPARAT